MSRIWNNLKWTVLGGRNHRNAGGAQSARGGRGVRNSRGREAVRRAVVIEALEGRTLMSGSAAVAAPLSVTEVPFDGGTQLQVTANPGATQIAVSQTADGLVVSDGAGWAQAFAPTVGVFKQIVARAGAGDFSVTLDPSVTVNAVLYAGVGNDTLVAGSGNDILYSGAGTDTLKAGAGNDTLVALTGSGNTLVGGAGQTSFWLDARAGDTVQGLTAAESAAGALHQVSSFLGTSPSSAAVSPSPQSSTAAARASRAGGKAAKPAKRKKPKKPKKPAKKSKSSTVAPAAPAPAAPAPVDNLMTSAPVNPKLTSGAAGYQSYAPPAHPLFADGGPTADDIAQGDVGDCFFLATLASVAKVDANLVRQSVVDLGDGTYAVQFRRGGAPVFVRVSADLPTTAWGSLAYADFGKQGSMWVAVMEKAYTFFRTGAGTYQSIDSGWMDEAYSSLGATSQSSYSAAGAQALINQIAALLSAGKSVTIAFSVAADGADLITSHAYTVVSVNTDATGKPASVVVRNPWGVTDNAGGDGYATLTAQQLFDSLLGYVSASV